MLILPSLKTSQGQKCANTLKPKNTLGEKCANTLILYTTCTGNEETF